MGKTVAWLFYAGQAIKEYTSQGIAYNDIRTQSPEIYNGGYVFFLGKKGKGTWYRCDFTPVLAADIPTELKAWELILI